METDIAKAVSKKAPTKNNHSNNSKTIIVINEHFTGTKTFKEKILDVMVRKLKNDK